MVLEDLIGKRVMVYFYSTFRKDRSEYAYGATVNNVVDNLVFLEDISGEHPDDIEQGPFVVNTNSPGFIRFEII